MSRFANFEAEGRPSVVRFAMPVKEYRFHDVVLGKEIVLAASQVQDFVIRKTDGMPTYHFAVVVDDAEMGITHVLRGQEHLLNTVNHIALQEALGYPRPILRASAGHSQHRRQQDGQARPRQKNPPSCESLAEEYEKSRLNRRRYRPLQLTESNWWLEPMTAGNWKRAEQQKVMPIIGLKETDLPEILVHDFRANGYLPEVLLNFLALLGWSPGGDKERMSIEEMIELFSRSTASAGQREIQSRETARLQHRSLRRRSRDGRLLPRDARFPDGQSRFTAESGKR